MDESHLFYAKKYIFIMHKVFSGKADVTNVDCGYSH